MKIKNPVLSVENVGRRDAGDPYIIRENGMYYYCYTCEEGVAISRFESLADIEKGEVKIVYDRKAEGANDTSWFAPELHKIDDRWYIYAAPGCMGDPGCHSMHVLRSLSDDIYGEYEYCGNMRGLEGKWAIDGTVFTHEGKLYMALSKDGITIVPLLDPLTLEGQGSVITTASEDWERVMSPVVEGSFMLKKGKYLHMLYAASDCRSDAYCLGLLTFSGGDITDPACWKKSDGPIFKMVDGIYGPGHCSVTSYTDKNGEERDLLVYHATRQSNGWEESKNGFNLKRCVYYGEIKWENDYPVLGTPQHEIDLNI